VNSLPGDGAESKRDGELFGEEVQAQLLAIQYSPAEIEAMKAVKRRLDPNWLLGQGTLFTNF
jgi:FAD/FMN-containing dehydrogenase